MENKFKLPVLVNEVGMASLTVEPSAKEHISYSELSTWMECSYRHKLKYLDKIKLDGPTEHTEFGTLMHALLENYVKTRVLPTDFVTIKQNLSEIFSKLPPKEDRVLPEKDWHDTIQPILEAIPAFMEENFPGWEHVDVEHALYENIEDQELKFKGFIDAVIRFKKTPTATKWTYVLLDWKTAGFGWTFDKKTDPVKLMQLVLYKIFYSKKMNIDLKDIRCGFVLLKRTNKKEKCELVTVSVGEKTIAKAEETLGLFLGSMKKKFYSKNRNSCQYCVYKNTEHCT